MNNGYFCLPRKATRILIGGSGRRERLIILKVKRSARGEINHTEGEKMGVEKLILIIRA